MRSTILRGRRSSDSTCSNSSFLEPRADWTDGLATGSSQHRTGAQGRLSTARRFSAVERRALVSTSLQLRVPATREEGACTTYRSAAIICASSASASSTKYRYSLWAAVSWADHRALLGVSVTL